MNEKIYYSAEDIAKMLGVSMGKSYKILREMNKELEGKGFFTIAGKIPMEYFRENLCHKAVWEKVKQMNAHIGRWKNFRNFQMRLWIKEILRWHGLGG